MVLITENTIFLIKLRDIAYKIHIVSRYLITKLYLLLSFIKRLISMFSEYYDLSLSNKAKEEYYIELT